MATPRFLAFGSTGYTGRFVSQKACGRDISVVAHLRPGSPRAATVGKTLQVCGAELATVPWNADDITALVERVAPSHVFTLLGITKAGAKREQARTGDLPTYQQVDTGYTNLVIDAVEQVAPHARLIYLSSLGADSPGGNAYLKARHAVEERLGASKLDYLIVRPSFISGEDRDEDRPGERIGSALADVALNVLGAVGAKTLRDRYLTVSGTELGQRMVAAALSPDLSRRAVDMVELRELSV